MAEGTPLTEKVDRTLNWLFGGAADIRELAPDWSNLHEAERASQEMEWFGDMTGELSFLHEHYVGGAMSEEQQWRYLTLLRELQGCTTPTGPGPWRNRSSSASSGCCAASAMRCP